MPKFPRFTPKTLTVTVGAVLLSACQITPHQQESDVVFFSGTKPVSYSASTPESAKVELIQALMRHMASERYAVATYRYEALPLSKEQIEPKPAPKKEENKVGSLPYLTYDDAVLGTNPLTVSRDVGMSDAYQAVSDGIATLQYNTAECVGDVSLQLDELVWADPTITDSDDRIKALKKNLFACQTDFNKEAKRLIKDAQGYQVNDLRHLQMCVVGYQKGIFNMMGATRNPRVLSGENYDLYDGIYQNYVMCTNIYHNAKWIEPYNYSREAVSELELKATSATKTCKSEAIHKQNILLNAGKNYQENADEFAQVYYDHVACTDEKLHKLLNTDEIPARPTTMRQAKDRIAEQSYLIDGIRYETTSDYQYAPYAGEFGWIKAYQEKTANEQETTAKSSVIGGDTGMYGGFLGKLLGIKPTPEQITARNLYQYNNTTMTSLSHHNPANRTHETMLSLDYNSPTFSQSIKLPIRADFDKGVVTADVSALLPVIALASPQNALLPKDVPNGQVYFALPEKLREQIPTDVIYQAIHDGIIESFGGLHGNKFGYMDIRQDKFAKDVRATHAIKISLTAPELAKMYDTIIEKVGDSLKSYVDKNPDKYTTEVLDRTGQSATRRSKIADAKQRTAQDKVKKLIDDLDKSEGLVQAIEKSLPFSLDTTSQIYLDYQGNIIATQTVGVSDDKTTGERVKSVGQVRYDKATFDKHALSSQFQYTFSQVAQLDGVSWIKNTSETNRLKGLAQEAREYYEGQSDCSQKANKDKSTKANACSGKN